MQVPFEGALRAGRPYLVWVLGEMQVAGTAGGRVWVGVEGWLLEASRASVLAGSCGCCRGKERGSACYSLSDYF